MSDGEPGQMTAGDLIYCVSTVSAPESLDFHLPTSQQHSQVIIVACGRLHPGEVSSGSVPDVGGLEDRVPPRAAPVPGMAGMSGLATSGSLERTEMRFDFAWRLNCPSGHALAAQPFSAV
jgi:hypothetical protein